MCVISHLTTSPDSESASLPRRSTSTQARWAVQLQLHLRPHSSQQYVEPLSLPSRTYADRSTKALTLHKCASSTMLASLQSGLLQLRFQLLDSTLLTAMLADAANNLTLFPICWYLLLCRAIFLLVQIQSSPAPAPMQVRRCRRAA